MIDHGRHPVLGIGINAMDAEAAVETVVRAAREKRALTVSCSAVHSVMEGVRDIEHRHRLNALNLVLPDGQPVRWALRWRHGISLPNRVYGPDFMLAVCARAEQNGLPIYLYGSRPEILDPLSRELRARFPALIIAGMQPSAFRRLTENQQVEIAADIVSSGARIVFAGLGCPRQEIWVYENAKLIPLPLIAVGAAFDFHAGLLAQAPQWMQRSGTEWLFRLRQEPRRLWKRYLYLNPLYLFFLAGELLGIARFGSGSQAHPKQIRIG